MSIEKLYIFEKPDAGKHFAKALKLNNAQRGKGFIQQGGICITWCFGHLLQQAPPEHYREDIKKGWSLEKLPIIPKEWEMTYEKSKKEQLFTIRDLLKKSQSCVIATDDDREGETIGWEVVEFFKYSGKKYRMIYSELTPKALVKSNDNLKDAEDYRSRYEAGLGRMRADWIMGFNLTMAYTAYNQKRLPPRNVINAGRVISPLVFLLTEKDNEIKNFKPENHWTFKADFNHENGDYSGNFIIPDELVEDKILKNEPKAKEIEKELNQEKEATIESHEEKNEKQHQPLGFSLSQLQKVASQKMNLSPKQTLDTAQSLYETHQLISYPRTDCQYVNEGQFNDRNDVINAVYNNIGNGDKQFLNVKQNIDKNIKSKIWNDKKISAHHAIVPTSEHKDIVKLSQTERDLYEIICKRYIAQFLPIHEYISTTIITKTKQFQHRFKTDGKVIKINGWKDIEKENDSKNTELPKTNKNDLVAVKDVKKESKKTNPPKHYTYETLLSDMNNIDKYIKNEKLKKIIKGKGIGTEATRADHIDGLFKKGFAKKEKKSIIATDKAHTVIEILPDENKQPEVSAYWEEELESIANKKSTLDKFLQKQESIINRIINKVRNGECEIKQNIKGKGKTYTCDKCESLVDKFKSKKGNVLWRCLNRECGALYADDRGKRGNIIEMVKQPEGDHPCPTCQSKMLRRKKKDEERYFWVCSDQNCKTFCKDDNGQLGEKIERKAKQTSEFDCPKCKDGKMVQKNGANGKFWGCNNFPECKTTLQDKDDRPDYENTQKKEKQKTDHKCPNCEEGYLTKRKKKGTEDIFWGCNNFPKCKTIKNDVNGKPEE